MTQRILLADDSVTIRKVVELTFSDEDVRITAVGDGAQALERARSERPDIVISDVAMPGLNGFELCERIRAEAGLRGVPCLLLRGMHGSFDEQRAGACGAAGVIVKPFEAQEMIRRVKELIAAAASPESSASLPVQPPAPPRTPVVPAPTAAFVPPVVAAARPAPPPPPRPQAAAPPPPPPQAQAAAPPPPPPRAPARPLTAPAAAVLTPLPPPPAPTRAVTVEAAPPAALSEEDFDLGPTASPTPAASAADDDLWSEVNLRGGSAPIIDPAVGEDSLWGSLGDTSILDEQAAPAPEKDVVLPRVPASPPERPARAAAPPVPVVPPAPPAAVGEQAAVAVDRAEIERLVAARLDAAVRQALEPLIAGLARSVIEDVVWQVVPELAETMIRAEIDRITRGSDRG